MTTWYRLAFVLFIGSQITGCAIGQRVDYRQAAPYVTVTSDKQVAVAVVDERPYVLKGSKRPTYVGNLRALYYNPYNVTTYSGSPLAADIQEAVRSALARASLDAVPSASVDRASGPGQRLLVIHMREWKSDAYMSTRFDYDLTASVIDENGRVLASKEAKQSRAVTNLITAGSGALAQLIGSEEIAAALAPTPSPPAPTATEPLSATPAPQGKTSAAYDDCMRRVLRISDPALRVSSMAMCDPAK